MKTATLTIILSLVLVTVFGIFLPNNSSPFGRDAVIVSVEQRGFPFPSIFNGQTSYFSGAHPGASYKKTYKNECEKFGGTFDNKQSRTVQLDVIPEFPVCAFDNAIYWKNFGINILFWIIISFAFSSLLMLARAKRKVNNYSKIL